MRIQESKYVLSTNLKPFFYILSPFPTRGKTDYFQSVLGYRYKSNNFTHSRVLAGMWRKILKGPLDILVRSQLSSECRRLLTAEPQNAVVGGQHPTVKKHHILIIMVSKDVIEGNVLGYHWVLNNKADILWTVSTHIVPK